MKTAGARSFHHGQFDPAALAEAKRGRVVSVCLPARDEEATVGTIVAAIREALVDRVGLVDEILVVDDASRDDTVAVAAAAGATVVEASDVLPELGPGSGKGEALWKSVHAARGELIAWCDADVTNFDSQFVVGLLGPLLTVPEIGFVKGYYERPVGEGRAEGGRVTELVARPLISLLFPHLAGIVQPLSGEYAGRREVLERLPFVEGYGVDLGLLVDVADRFGVDAIAQVDLGVRIHRNRPLVELSPQALAVLHTALRRAGLARTDPAGAALLRPGADPLVVGTDERPPLVGVPAYRRRSA
ncbi:MAG: glucosyl-3-phosphoglycerate synthase [Acidimicrobiales bacterium]|nr:glucosyl-3-phosphoglycerate synthase [Acidimicrobiales bacterium]